MKCRDNPRQLHVLYVSDGGPRVQALTEVLRNRGHQVHSAHNLREILLAKESHVLVLDVAHREEEQALQLLEEIEHAGSELPIVMICAQRSYELCRGAAQYGVPALIQEAFAPTALTNAVEHCADDHSPDAPARIGHSGSYLSASQESHEALQGLVRYLDQACIPAAHSARVLAASAELLDNVERHAFEEDGEYQVQAQLRNSRLWISVSDSGCGIDRGAAQQEATAPALPFSRKIKAISKGVPLVFGGLSRVARLADRFELIAQEQGTCVELEFELSPVACATGELPQLQSLQPESVRSLVRRVETGRLAIGEIDPILALTVQRLVGHECVQRRSLKRV